MEVLVAEVVAHLRGGWRSLRRREAAKEKFEERVLGARRAVVERDVTVGDEISLAMVRETETAIAWVDGTRK